MNQFIYNISWIIYFFIIIIITIYTWRQERKEQGCTSSITDKLNFLDKKQSKFETKQCMDENSVYLKDTKMLPTDTSKQLKIKLNKIL